MFFLKQWQIPDGVTLEQITAYAEQRLREQRRKYNKEHPEVIEQQRIRTYTNFLKKRNFIVIPGPLPPVEEWDYEPTKKAILRTLMMNMEGACDE